MESDRCYETFRNSPLAAELDPEQCTLLARQVVCHSLKDGEVLLAEGHVDQRLYVIGSGNLAVTRETGGGEWVVLHILRSRDLAGELGFLDGLGHSATLRSIGPTDVYSLDRASLEALLDAQPRLVYQVMRAVIRSVHATLRRMNAQYVEMTNYISKQHGRY